MSNHKLLGEIIREVNEEKISQGINSTYDLLSLPAKNYKEAKYTWLLKDLQANILKPHGKQCALFTFISFKRNGKSSTKESIKKALSELELTSAMEQMIRRKKQDRTSKAAQKGPVNEKELKKDSVHLYTELINRIKENGNPQNRQERILHKLVESPEDNIHQPITCLYLSKNGYQYFLGEKTTKSRHDAAFLRGLEAGTELGSPHSSMHSEIEPLYKMTIDAMLMVAFDENDLSHFDGDTLRDKKEQLKKYIKEETANFANVFFEMGFRNPDHTNGASRDWFGFKDGITNPRFFPQSEITGSSLEWEKPSPLNLVLRRDSGPAPDSCGSYMVFMKMKQNREAFEKAFEELGKKLNQTPEYAASLFVGRHKDGTPLVHSATEKNRPSKNFNYKYDSLGTKCPFHAHVRLANPREGNEYQRIVRRGMVYGNQGNSSGKGILFMSFQGALQQQFENLLNDWIFNFDYNGRPTGQDSLLSQNSNYKRFFKNWGKGGPSVSHSQEEPFVSFKGGLYFYAPSISFIKTKLGKYW